MNSKDITDILLAEDNPEDAELTLRALAKVNLAHRVVHVEDGQQALDFIFGEGEFKSRGSSNYPRVVLLDIKMPKVDGIEVLRKLKSTKATRLIPVVIMTSSAEDRDIIESYELGVNSYVVKPVDFNAFSHAVSELGLYWMLVNKLPQRG
jgi:two-component system, response regulator